MTEPVTGSVAEGPPKTRGVVLLGFAFVVLLGAAFAFTVLRKKPVNVPHGLLGARFGMALGEVREKLPELAPVGDGALAGNTRVFELPAHCRLSFGIDGLSGVACTIAEQPSADEHHRTKKRLLATLRQLYGEESEAAGGESERWSWRSSRAELRLVSEREPRWTLRVENVAHHSR